MARNSKRRSDKRKVRIKKTYSMEEIAILFEKTEGTVLTWIADGLPKIDALEPPLVYGWELKQWHEEWWDRRRKKCAANEFYCCHCQDVRPAEPGTITFSVRVADGIRGVAVCSVCGTSVVRNFSVEHALEAGRVLGENRVEYHDSTIQILLPVIPGFICQWGILRRQPIFCRQRSIPKLPLCPAGPVASERRPCPKTHLMSV